jgi:hypothetical protein
MSPSPLRATASAEPCADHRHCIRFYRPRGAINEAGWWDAQWGQNSWHVRGPDPADAGFPTLGGPVDRVVDPDPDENPLEALRPYVGEDALQAALDLQLPSDEESAASQT